MKLSKYCSTKTVLVCTILILFTNALQGTNERLTFVLDKMVIESEKNKLSIAIQTLEEDKVTNFKQIEIQFQGRKISVPKEDLADINGVWINHWKVYTHGSPKDPKDRAVEGELRLVIEYGFKIPRDKNDKYGERSKVVFSFGKKGYGGRRRYVPTAGEDRWNVFEKPKGEPEEAGGETSIDFDGDSPQKV